MINFLLYTTATLIWGSTWLGIKLQLTQVPPILSVGYRFCLASFLLLLFCLFTGKKLRFRMRDQFFMAVQGFTLFGLGYCMSYLATSYLTSGLVAVVYTTMLMGNILNLKLFMRQPVAWRAFWGGMLGLSGICIIFWHDLAGLTATRGMIGLGMGLLGAYLSSLGNVVGSRNAKVGIPVTQANVYGMAYGGLLTLFIHFASGGALVMDWSFGYLGPMLYLTLFGSIIAFGCYMLLIGRIGAEYAAYVTLLMPIIALLLSTLFEEYHWSMNAVLGIVIVLAGNLVTLTSAETWQKLFRRIGLRRPIYSA
ncbi:MAG: EamA family transporter [Deltaproteobacteria bacterium]|nr:EamA family transporter [Deltaproteobacteria bacterium]